MMLKAQLGQSETVRSFLLPPHKPFNTGLGHGKRLQVPIRKEPYLYPKWKCCSSQQTNSTSKADSSTSKADSSVSSTQTIENRSNTFESRLKKRDFPHGFLFGVSSAAYQYEGAANEGGRGPSIWDTFSHIPGNIKDDKNGDVAVDQYHRYKEDIALMKHLGINAYRFSISWSRILPTGKVSGGVNEEGIQYYNNLINELRANGIEPVVTLFHWDVPQPLEDEYGGFLSGQIINDFKEYAELCYIEFGNRVKKWITVNEPWTFTVNGYISGIFPPGKSENPGTDPYKVAHNFLLAHAEAADLYKKNYKAVQGGEIGISLNCMHFLPYHDDDPKTYQDHIQAVQRATDFMFGWFMNPIKDGNYPQSMRQNVGERLPNFEEHEKLKLIGSIDFLGLNYYTAKYVVHAPNLQKGSYWTDGCYEIRSRSKDAKPIGKPTASSWLHIVPEGLDDVLLYIKNNYNDPVVYISENGIPDGCSLSMEEVLADHTRVDALEGHLRYLKEAIHAGCEKVKGYFVWSLLDNFEWDVGYTVRFGIYYVDFNDNLKRYPKKSAIWFRNFLQG